MNLYAYIHACRTFIYLLNNLMTKMNAFSAIYNRFVYFGSNLFKVKNSSNGESQVKLTSTKSIGINDLYNSETGSNVKSRAWNHIFLRVCTGVYMYLLIVYIKTTNEGFYNLFL